MPYSAPLDVIQRWPKTTTSNLDNDELRALIADADALIDAKIARRYQVPVTTDPANAPPLLKMLSTTLALLDVFNRAQTVPDWIKSRLDRADAILTGLSDGSLQLVDATGVVAPFAVDDLPTSTTDGYVPVFGGVPSITERQDPVRRNDERGARGLPPTWPGDW